MSYNKNAMAAYQQYGQTMTASGGGRNMSGLGAKSSTSSMTSVPDGPVDFTTIDTKTGKQTKVATIRDYGIDNDDGPNVLYAKAANAATAAGVDLVKAAAKPSVDPKRLYSEPRFNIEQQATKIEDYLRGTAVQDALIEAQGFEKPYSGLYIAEDRPMTEAELQKYKPLIDMADDVMNENITVEELGDMDREDQEAFLRAIGVQGLGPAKRKSSFVGGDFDVATTEEEFVRDLLNQGLSKTDAAYWDKLGDFRRQKEEAEDVVDLSPPEAADQELIPTTTAKPDVAPAIDTTPPAETGKGLMSRRLDGKDGTTATKEYKLSKDELIEQAKEMFPDNPVAAAAFIATVEAESAGGKDMTENGYTKRQAIKKFVEPYKGSDGKLGPKMKARKDAIEKAKSSAEIFEIVYGGGPTGNKNLGNTEPGDGFRFIGRGPIQLTGRANYEKYGKRAGYDIVNNPELMATNQEVSMAVTKEYLKDKGIDSVQKARDLYNVIGHSGGMKEAAKRWENVKKLYESTYGYDWDRAFSPRPMLRPTE